MAERARDWFLQAEADLRHARNARDSQDYDWSAFASQQAAEKAIKALFQRLHLEAWGHVLSSLLAHVFIVLTHSSRPVRDRVATFLPDNFPVPLDVFPFTRAEMAELSSSPLLAGVSKSGWRYSRSRDETELAG
ncbi:MAG: HEPN domain-containing protein [Chthoniobacterales bacterium]|nr:HEPN domain-containing protein [Chthoniobacterales bacterium]